ncbi:MAG: hypothetical protein MJB57_04360 [Gemmatimonadetes bacterium]|nr:hypothetical protein [Gemmatimonadota bacterium]
MLLALLASTPTAAAAQEWLGGLAVGTAAGFLVGTGAVSGRAILFDRPVYGISEGLSLARRFTIGGAATGTIIGIAAPERTGRFARNAAHGTWIGGLLGLGLGYLVEPERPLGVMMMGMAAGIVAGTVIALVEDDDSDGSIQPSRGTDIVLLSVGL